MKLSLLLLILASVANASTAVRVRPRLADRVYIANVLGELFGPAAQSEIRRSILNAELIMGGACDVYAQVRVGDKATAVADPQTFCQNGKQAMSIPMVPESSLMYEAHMRQVCHAITQLPAAVAHFPAKPGRIAEAFTAFNPMKTPSPPVVASLAKIGTWPEILFTLCLDSQWRIL